MTQRPKGAPKLRKPTARDFQTSLSRGWQDFTQAPLIALFFASFFAGTGMLMALVTCRTGQTFWLVLAVLGFPLIGTLAAVGFYEVSRRIAEGIPLSAKQVAAYVWSLRGGQLPWLAAVIVVIFLFWLFLAHMIFALFLGLSPMTHISTSAAVFLTPQGAAMIAVGTAVGAVFATLVFAISLHGIPMLLDREVDFITAMLASMAAMAGSPLAYLAWGSFLGLVALLSMLPLFSGLFISMPVLGHATWHLYKTLSKPEQP